MSDNQSTENEFFRQKMNLLRQLLSCSEAMMNDTAEWGPVEDMLDERDRLIDQLSLLEAHQQQTGLPSPLSKEQRAEIRRTVKLISALDQDVEKKIRKEQNEILAALKHNVQQQKLIPYGAALPATSGRWMDCKK